MAVPDHGSRPTLEDVAEYAGVSRSTASRAMNPGSSISRRARQAVLAAAQDLGYSPNQAARSLATRRTGAVALVLSEPEATVLDDPYYLIVMRAAFRELAGRGSAANQPALIGAGGKRQAELQLGEARRRTSGQVSG